MNKKFIYLFTILVIVLFQSCKQDDELTLDELSKEYFLEIAFGNEFTNGGSVIRKWDDSIKIFLKNTSHSELVNECERIIEELNQLSQSITIERVLDESDANFVVFFSDKDTYADFEPNAEEYLNSNLGFVWIYWNSLSEIYSGSMYVDITRVDDINCQKHLLREELTQGLGLLNDSYLYSESIFYQNWTCTPLYAEIDKLVIKYLLDPKINAGMDKNQVMEILKEIN